MKKAISIIPIERIEGIIHHIRDQKVILDQDLAALYGVETKALNQAVQRNIERFPEDFSFQLNKKEWGTLKSQIVTSNELSNLKSQFVTSRSWGGRRKLPRVFTEQGVAMLSSVLRSSQAVTINIEIMRAFVKMRHFMTSQKKMTKEFAELKSFLLKHSNSSDREFRKIWQAIEKLSIPPSQKERQIGFKLS